MITSLRRGALILTGGVLAVAAIALPVQAASSPPAAQSTRWRAFTSITERGRSVYLLGIDAVSRRDAWADGIIQPANPRLSPKALIEHWNGRTWQRSAVPAKAAATVTADDQFLTSIGATSAHDVWAFGSSGAYLHLGRAGWQTGSLPRKIARSSAVVSANVFSSTDVWVFGIGNDTATRLTRLAPFAARFNGHRWRAFRMPGRGGTGFVSALSRDDMWALTGQYLPARRGSGPRLVRWNGKSWQLAAVQPNLPAGTQLYSVLALSKRDVWVAGTVPNKLGTSPLAEHWNGRDWQVISPSAPVTSAEIALSNLVPDGSGGIWAMSTNIDGTSSSFWHYAGGRWSRFAAQRDWWDASLAAVPHSTSTWAIAGVLAGRGLILLHGRIPR
jgi:hypothetical protein